jgi:hypothetical protein
MCGSLRPCGGVGTLGAVTRTRRTTAAALAALVVVGAFMLRAAHRAPALGPLVSTPAVDRLSVRVGERVQFTARADGAARASWSIWGRTVSTSEAFTYVPSTDDAGWQHVTVEIAGSDGTRHTRTWDVGVVPAVAPELVDVVPPPGAVTVGPADVVRFRSGARVPAARPSDRLRFEWIVDDASVQRDDSAADAATSELTLPSLAAGEHRVVLRVSEEGVERSMVAAEWRVSVPADEPVETASATGPTGSGPGSSATAASTRVDVSPSAPVPSEIPATAAEAGPTPPPAGPAVGAAPPPVHTASAPPEPPPPTLVRAPGGRRIEAEAGDRITLRVTVLPPDAAVRYAWTVDGRRVTGAGGELALDAGDAPGTRRVAVRVSAAGREIGRDAWTIGIRAQAAIFDEPVAASVAPPPIITPRAPVLDEVEVRRWLEEYARAWSRKDTVALRRMGQIRSPAEASEMQRYFESIDALRVELHVRAVRIAGERASVEFERTDTVTDPSGRRQQLKLPPMRKEIERSPDGLRFVARGGAG